MYYLCVRDNANLLTQIRLGEMGREMREMLNYAARYYVCPKRINHIPKRDLSI